MQNWNSVKVDDEERVPDLATRGLQELRMNTFLSPNPQKIEESMRGTIEKFEAHNLMKQGQYLPTIFKVLFYKFLKVGIL